MKTSENVRANAKSIARCRSDAGSAPPPRTGVALLCALGWVFSGGCDDPARSGAGTGGAGTGSGGAAGTGTGGVAGTGTGGAAGTGTGGDGGASSGCPDGPGLALGVAVHGSEGNQHVGACTTVSYLSQPPSSGMHYPTWPAFKSYAQPVPWGFLVHGLEHGAIVVVYNCPGGCPDEVANAQAWIEALPIDAFCGTPPRVLLAPDPTLGVRWAATSWTWTLRACEFDPAVFQQFFTDHYNAGLETVCGHGDDLSAAGWCP